jgi:N-acetylmuramoyl-L-alanine amidase
MDYLKAVMRKDEQSKIDALKEIIDIGEKLGKNVTPDKKKLEILSKRLEKTTSAQSNSSSNNKLFSINSVYTSDNSIIIDFNVDIDSKDIKFFELKQSNLFRDVYDINGYFKDAIPTKLQIAGVDRITLGQFKPDVLRVVFSHNKNLPTSYKVSKRQIIISVDSLEKAQEKAPEIKKEEIKPKFEPVNVDTQNSIRSIDTYENKIIVKFNKNYSKKDINQFSKKNGNKYEYTFDIAGKYKYTGPTKLKIDNIDRILVTDDKDNVRIKISNDNNPKITYALSSRELSIDIIATASEKSNNTKEPEKNTIPEALPAVVAKQVTSIRRNKTIVLDAGHGGEDAGAVGPNKRYEKVINLNVTKYLAAILKQRGYKVYLTRSKDIFIKVMERTVLANEKDADLFMSIHTNAVPKEKANEVDGIETFFLSPAREERAKRVAALENKSDIREMSASSKDVFLESLNRPRITASHKFAIDVQAGILQSARSKYKDVQDSGVREGPFWVLVGAQMPSILVELGYITHPVEGKRLYDKSYQQLLANGIANGVDSYFSKNP